MSRIGDVPLTIPNGVSINITDEALVVEGSKGEISVDLHPDIHAEQKDDAVVITRENDKKKTKSFHGLVRSLVENAIIGVTDGFTKRLIIKGVGYRASMSGKNLTLSLGFSHDITFEVPEGVDIRVKDDTIIVSGIDKQLVGQVAANIRSFRKPEPYKGKGIRYEDERVRRKAGKAAAAALE